MTEETPAQNIRAILVAVLQYQVKYNSLPPSLSSLGPPSTGKEANRDAANLIDSRLALGSKIGYVFQYNRSLGSFTITADPSGGDAPTTFHYFCDQLAGINPAVIRQQMGHTSAAMTRLYTREIPIEQVQAEFSTKL